jgi:AraC-like DNA-binding protein
MDVLSDVLTLVRLQSTVCFSPELSSPWGIRFPAKQNEASFYVLSRGSCYVEVDGAPGPVSLVGGDLIMLPHGTAHVLRDSLQSSVVPAEQLLKDEFTGADSHQRQPAEGGGKTAIVAGHFKFANRLAGQLIAPLPQLIHIRAEDGGNVPWLETTLRFLASESASEAPGSDITRARLTDVLFIQIMRAFLTQVGEDRHSCEEKGSILRALSDHQIGKALACMHRDTQRAWTVAELAEQVNMSRTSFAVRFRKLAGMSPLDYLTKWRMEKASAELLQGESSIDEIAHVVGYESGPAFNKAFKRAMGVSPGAYRKEQVGFINPIFPR